ncbi:cytochrome c oxidase assembly protein [Coralloluteibacterium thermophilus]|uniref:Cytochrome c oxidase assembly protein n=1 Tax=Coralloluteibacterium thermophilum TaxID=2707049 RepID=A0ABV9NP30_9GAMM
MHAHHDAALSPGQWLPWAVGLVLVGAYLVAARRRRAWSRWRGASFGLGVALLAWGLSAQAMAWAHADLRGHMAQHLAIGMFAPLFLVLGAPLTLLLGALPVDAARRLVRVLHGDLARVLVHPVVALVLNVGGMALLYLTPLYAMSRHDLALHALVHYHFVAAGYLYAWALVGPDPAPRRPSLRYRAVVLFVGAGTHALLGKVMYAGGFPHGTGASLAEREAAAQWMYYGGDLAELLLAVALFAIWYRQSAPAAATAGARPA